MPSRLPCSSFFVLKVARMASVTHSHKCAALGSCGWKEENVVSRVLFLSVWDCDGHLTQRGPVRVSLAHVGPEGLWLIFV